MTKKTTLQEIGEMVTHLIKHMATKDDIRDFAKKDDLRNLATREDVKALSDRVRSIEKGQDKILEELQPLSKAHDKDSEAIIDHGKRISRIEKRLAV